MKKIYLFFLLAVAVSFLSACSDDEDTTPSYADVERFAPASDDNSELAAYRRSFYDNTSCYLLFSDTLRKEQTGVDVEGRPVYKTDVLDIAYSLFGSSTDYNSYTFDYITDFAGQKKAAELVNEKLLKRLGTIAPFSVLIVDKINAWKSNNGVLTPVRTQPTYYLGTQCYVFSIEHGKAFEDEKFFDNVMAQIVLAQVKAKGDSFLRPFFDLVDDYDRKTGFYDKDELGYPLGYDDDLARSLGFLRDGSKWNFRNKNGDIQDYVSAIFAYTKKEFMSEYGTYPICVARYNKMKELISSLGVVLDD